MAALQDCRCPICGEPIVEAPKSYSCRNWKKEDGACTFKIWKTFRDRQFTIDEVVRLINGEEIGPIEYVSHKTGKPYQAMVVYDLPSGALKARFPE